MKEKDRSLFLSYINFFRVVIVISEVLIKLLDPYFFVKNFIYKNTREIYSLRKAHITLTIDWPAAPSRLIGPKMQTETQSSIAKVI